MSHFSIALQRAIDGVGEGQIPLASRLRMDPSQLSKYYNGRTPVGPIVLEKFLDAFPEAHRAPLLSAYLLDQLPEKHRHLVDIQERGASAKPHAERPADSLRHLPKTAQDALHFIGSKCHERPVLDLVLDLARLLQGRA